MAVWRCDVTIVWPFIGFCYMRVPCLGHAMRAYKMCYLLSSSDFEQLFQEVIMHGLINECTVEVQRVCVYYTHDVCIYSDASTAYLLLTMHCVELVYHAMFCVCVTGQLEIKLPLICKYTRNHVYIKGRFTYTYIL